MKNITPATLLAIVLSSTFSLVGCGDGPTRPGGGTTSTTTTTAPPASQFRVSTLLTVYVRASEGAQWTQGEDGDDRIGRILLGVDTLAAGTTVLDNEAGRVELQAAIDRLNAEFTEADYRAAFDETRANLERFLNDADNDGWSIDGRSGANRDWPYDSNGNDPDGWTAQMVITVTAR